MKKIINKIKSFFNKEDLTKYDISHIKCGERYFFERYKDKSDIGYTLCSEIVITKNRGTDDTYECFMKRKVKK